MIGRLVGTAVLVFLVADTAAGQRPTRIDDPVDALLDLRRELDLTRTQIAGLREIQRRLFEANRPLVEELLAVQRQVRAELTVSNTGARRLERRPSETHMSALRRPMELIQANNVSAMQEVNAILTESQKRRAAMLLRIRDRRRGWGSG